MNAFQNCQNTSDAVPLYLPQQLYLKPISRLNISLQLPSKMMGKSVSNREVMEQLRFMIKPEEFSLLKVTKTNIEFIRFEAETETKSKLDKVVTKLNHKFVKLKDFPESMKLRASEAKSTFPTRHTWDTFFREAKDMNEMKPGERPDTVYISNLPIKWFVPYHLSGEDDIKPSEQIFFRVFEKFGRIRNIDIPVCDPYRNKMKREVSGMQVFDFTEENFFEGYVQFKDYVGFTKAMEALQGMKLMHKTDGEVYTVNINVDFDKSKHLSDASIRRREIVRDRLVKKELDREDKERREQEEENSRILVERQKEVDKKLAKEQRRRQREEKRKTKLLDKLKVKGSDEISEKILKEEKKLLKAQRKLEAIRLIEELFKRIKIKKEKTSKVDISKGAKADELSQFKSSSEMEVLQQRDKLNRVIEGRIVLKSILGSNSRAKKRYDDSSSSDSSIGELKEKFKKRPVASDGDGPTLDQNEPCVIPQDWYGYHPANGLFPYQVPSIYPHYPNYVPYNPRSRGRGRNLIPGSSRGNFFPRRGRGFRYRGSGKSSYPPEIHAQYYRYFEKFLSEHDDRPHHTYSRSSRSRSRSRQKSVSRRSRSRSYNRSRSRSRTRSYSRDHKSQSKSRRSRTRKSSYKASRSRSSSRSRSKSRSKSRSPSRSKRKGKQRITSKRSNSANSRKSHSASPSKQRESHKSRDRQKSRSPSYRSIDSSKFISPSRLRLQRSKSWSLPKESNSSNKKSWSKSPSH